jgi:hypothetical protein
MVVMDAFQCGMLPTLAQCMNHYYEKLLVHKGQAHFLEWGLFTMG